MTIGIVIYGCKKRPGGGIKVIYQYANFLAENENNQVILYFDMNLGRLKRYIRLKRVRQYVANKIVQNRPRWYQLNARIEKRAVLGINNSTVNDGDIILATALETANPVANLDGSKGKKFYFIQDFENWHCSDETVLESYRLGMTNITVAKWLSKIVDSVSEKCSCCISNGIDNNIFCVKNPLKNRQKYSIAMQYRSSESKGCKYAIEVIRILERKYPDLKVIMFSSEFKPDNLPVCCEYVMGASQTKVAEIDNDSIVFLCSSICEGFGLPGLEAMACGCVLVASEYEGVFEYAQNGVNALLSPIRDVEAMAENIIKLFENDELRIWMAQNARKTGMEKSFTASAIQFERVLLENLQTRS